MFRPGQGPRISPVSLTSLADVSFSGQGASWEGPCLSVGMILSSSFKDLQEIGGQEMLQQQWQGTERELLKIEAFPETLLRQCITHSIFYIC